MGINPDENLQLDLLESEHNGRILIAKNFNSSMTKFYDLDLLEPMNDVYAGKGTVYCSKNGDFVCTIEKNCRLVIKRIENGEFYGNVDFSPNEIGHVYLSNSYAAITLRKLPSPILIDLKLSRLIQTLPFQTYFCTVSPDDNVLLVHSEKAFITTHYQILNVKFVLIHQKSLKHVPLIETIQRFLF